MGAEPVEGLTAQASALRVVEPGGIFALAGGGEHGDEGGVVAVVRFQVIGQLGVGGEGGGVEAGRACDRVSCSGRSRPGPNVPRWFWA